MCRNDTVGVPRFLHEHAHTFSLQIKTTLKLTKNAQVGPRMKCLGPSEIQIEAKSWLREIRIET